MIFVTYKHLSTKTEILGLKMSSPVHAADNMQVEYS